MTSEAWAARFAPEPFREFLPYVTPSALRVIHTTQVLRRALEIAQQLTNTGERSREAQRLGESLERAGLGGHIGVTDELGGRLDPAQLGADERIVIGQRVLALYFHQLHWQGPLFLDLRPKHFSWNRERQQLLFSPNSLWFRPDPEFMVRLRALYAGFYAGDSAQLAEGLELYRWQSSPSPGFSARIEQLLRTHFGRADGGWQSPVYDYIADVMRSLAPMADRLGVATIDEIDADTLASRLRDEATRDNACIMPPPLITAWAHAA